MVALLCARVRQFYRLWTLLVYVHNSRYLIWQLIKKSAILFRFTADKTEKSINIIKNCSQDEDELWCLLKEVFNNRATQQRWNKKGKGVR